MNKKTLLGFLAGAAFVLGLLVTCGTGSKGGGTRTAKAGGATTWEHAAYYELTEKIEVPTSATAPDISGCKSTVCALNALGADGWELVAVDEYDYFFKRPK